MFYQLGPHRVDLTRAIYPRHVVQQQKQNSHQFVFSTKANPKTAPRRHSANTCALLIMRIIDFNASINKHWLSPLHPQGEVCLRQSYYLKKVLMLAANATELVSNAKARFSTWSLCQMWHDSILIGGTMLSNGGFGVLSNLVARLYAECCFVHSGS